MALVLALGTATLPASAAPRVPPGFEALVEGQTEQLDVRLFGRGSGLVPVHVTLEHVRLQEPEAVLQALQLPPEARDQLLPALSRPLARNTHLACRHAAAVVGCGYIAPPEDPAVVHALYDEGEGAVHLFIARQWLPQPVAGARRHRVSAGASNAFLHQQIVNLSGNGRHRSLAAQGSGMLGVLRQGHLAADWSFSRQDHEGSATGTRFGVDSAYYRHDLAGRYYVQAGRIDRSNLSSPLGGTFGFSLLPLDRFDGLRLGTTQAYLDAEAAVQSTPLTILLARPARVDAFEGERLLQTWYLPPGITTLDTRLFPFGSYTVLLRVYEDGVLVRSETAPFDKSGAWADEGTQWFVQGGRRSERHAVRADRGRSFMAGMRLSHAPGLASTVGLADIEGERHAEARLDVRRALADRELRAVFSHSWGTDGSRGQQHQVSFRRRAAWNASYQRLRGPGCRPDRTLYDRGRCVDALSVSMSLPWAGGSSQLGYTRRAAWRSSAAPVIGPRRPLVPEASWWLPVLPEAVRRGQVTRAWQASHGRTRRWNEFSVSTRVGLWQQHAGGVAGRAVDRGFHVDVSLSRLQRSTVGSSQRRYGMDLRQPEHARPTIDFSAAQSLRQDAAGGYREVTAELRTDNADRHSAGIAAQAGGNGGHTGLAVTHYQQGGRGTLGYSATHNSGVAVDTQGVYWGGGAAAQSGLAVQVGGLDDVDLHGVAAELQVAGSGRQRLQLGERRFLPLTAYQSHEAEVQDASAVDTVAAVRVGGPTGARPVFLTPGRLMRMRIPIEVTWTFVGNARDLAGLPLEGARILNAPLPAVAANGGFIAEFAQRETALYLLKEARLLQCPLAVLERRSVVQVVGTVTCEPIAVARLPAQIREQARVLRLLREQSLIAPAPMTASAGAQP